MMSAGSGPEPLQAQQSSVSSEQSMRPRSSAVSLSMFGRNLRSSLKRRRQQGRSAASHTSRLDRTARESVQESVQAPQMRRMRFLRDHFKLTEEMTSGTVLYLSQHYRKIPGSGVTGQDGSLRNLYDELYAQFGALGVQITSDPDATFMEDQRCLMLVVLCPGFFSCPGLVEETAHALRNIRRQRKKANLVGTQRCIASQKNLLDEESTIIPAHASNREPGGAGDHATALAFEDVATAAAMGSHEPLPKVRLYTPKVERRRSHAASLERSSLSSADAAAGTPRQKNSGASSPRGGDDAGGGRLGEGSVNPRLRLGSISVGSPRQRLASISIALSERVTRPRLSSISAGFGELRRRYHRKPKELVPLASTAISYDEYVRTCPPDLKGLFEWSFEKWPGMPMWGANRRLADECRQNRLLIRGPVSGQSRRRCSRRPSRQRSSSFRVITPQRQQSHTPTSFTGSVGAAAKPRR